MKKKKVVITGMGVVSCFGSDTRKFYEALLAGQSGVRPISSFDVSAYPTRFAAEVAEFSTEGFLDKKNARRVDPAIAYAVVAGKQALAAAQLDPEAVDKSRAGILISSGMGGMHAFTDGILTIYNQGYKRLTPFFVPCIITNMPGAFLAIELGFQGPNYSISTACATATYSIISALRHIQHGDADLMLAGGVEAAINPVGLSGFVALKALSEKNDAPEAASRPWDKGRSGFVMGEGCGVLVLESEEHAKKRGAPILAEVLGGYTNCDAHHMTDPVGDGSRIAACIAGALADATLKPQEVDYVNAHATATLAGDLCEIRAIKKVFGCHYGTLKINATKSLIGHALGASGALAAIAIVSALQTGVLHPTINCDDPEEELGNVDIISGQKKSYPVKIALSNSFGFGGHNAVLAIGKYT